MCGGPARWVRGFARDCGKPSSFRRADVTGGEVGGLEPPPRWARRLEFAQGVVEVAVVAVRVTSAVTPSLLTVAVGTSF